MHELNDRLSEQRACGPDGLHGHQGREGLTALKVLVTIVDRSFSKKVKELFIGHHTQLIYVTQGLGTANSEILDMLGLGGVDKNILFCVVPGFRVLELMEALTNELDLCRKGMGIAFAIPLSGVYAAVERFFDEDTKDFLERQVSRLDKHMEQIKSEITHDLIVAVINQGSSDDLMDAAKEAGATGGTILHARRVGAEDVSKFFGITVQPEKEIVAILVPREQKRIIMKALNKSCGLQSEAKGIILSLPVDGVAGITTE